MMKKKKKKETKNTHMGSFFTLCSRAHKRKSWATFVTLFSRQEKQMDQVEREMCAHCIRLACVACVNSHIHSTHTAHTAHRAQYDFEQNNERSQEERKVDARATRSLCTHISTRFVSFAFIVCALYVNFSASNISH